ncbi:MAG: cellulase family glycosylhydrolase [Armatimonadota bacterium]|nr:MAG: cellulase family glycosylhydrolase [Armatimonadota bacterium]
MDRFNLWKSGALRGANAFPRHTVEDLSALRSWGANLVSFGVFSVLDMEEPFALKPDAFRDMDTALDRTRRAGLFATINFRSAPGREDFNTDLRQFQDFKYHDAFANMWRETARHLEGNTTLVGYDLMCEPHPEDLFSNQGLTREQIAEKIKGTPADWNLLARRATQVIREEDPDTPIIVNSSGWAYPHAFDYLELTRDPRTIYSVHYYSPRHYTHQKPDKPVPYPGVVPAHVEPEQHWSTEVVVNTLSPVRAFQEKHDVPIFAGEFGCARYAPGVLDFMRDVINCYEDWGWSWAYWDLRGWDVMDIEMSPDPNDKIRHPDTPLLRLYKTYFARCEVYPQAE